MNKNYTFVFVRKQYIASVFIILAGLVLLVHTLLPHNHHDALVCFTQAHIQHCDGNDKDAAGEDVQHGQYEDCILKQVVLREKAQHADYLQLIITPVFLLFNQELILALFSETKWKPSPYLIHYFTSYISPILGLRAPPVHS